MIVNKDFFIQFSMFLELRPCSVGAEQGISPLLLKNRLGQPQMAKARWRQRLGRRVGRIRWATRPTISARRLAFAIVVEGGRPEQVRQILRWCGVSTGSGRQLYEAMREVCRTIVALARESMAAARANLPPNTVIAFDGSWDHRRHGSKCLFSVISSQSGQVIEAAVVSKSRTDPSEILCESSTMMEAEGLRAVLPSLRQIPQITGYVHDNDAKARNIIQQSGWEITEFLDPGHAKKSFLRCLQKFEKENAKILRDIENALTHWMEILVHSHFTVEQKVFLWQNTMAHMSGNHQHCIHGPMIGPAWYLAGNPLAMQALKSFLDATQFIIEKCNGLYSTQSNESLHRRKLKFATKDVKWGFTWQARVMGAILSRNMIGWQFEVYRRLGLEDLPRDIEIALQQHDRQVNDRTIAVRTLAYRIVQNQQRNVRRNVQANQARQRQPLQYEANPYLPIE